MEDKIVERVAPSAAKKMRFSYIINKILSAPILDFPFRHIYIENLFNANEFVEIISSKEINVPPVESDAVLIDALYQRNFKEISFPGTTTDISEYLAWHADRATHVHRNQETCEGYGVTMRLQTIPKNTILDDVRAVFDSDGFWTAAAHKFGLQLNDTRRDFGVQKYFDGYEISPHPDIRQKALTFMANINPAGNSEHLGYHTHYLKFKPEREYIGRYWENDPTCDRSWLPWSWCETAFLQNKNNSLVMFAPDNDTMHAVKRLMTTFIRNVLSFTETCGIM